MAVKQNQGRLYDQIQSTYIIDLENEFEDAPYHYDKTINKDHGRIETRECWVTSDPEYVSYVDPDNHWQQLRSLVIVKATRMIGDKSSSQIRYYISNLEVDAKKMLRFVRQHWEVENKLHWSLNATFREDYSRVRIGLASENLARLRKMALNLLRQNKSKKFGSKI